MADTIDKPRDRANGADTGKGRDPSTGRFSVGAPAGPGRKAIPEWLRGASDELLRLQHLAATKGIMPQANPDAPDEPDGVIMIEVPVRWRAVILDSLIDRIHGKPAIAQEPPPGDESIAELLVRLATSQPPIK